MCGIFGQCGYTPNNLSVVPLSDYLQNVLDGLHALQYRGYDSCGIAWFSNSFMPQEISLARTLGPVSHLKPLVKNTLTILNKSTQQIQSPWWILGHTRWATHGDVSLPNTHPHVANGYALVHNGVMRNTLEIHKYLKETYPDIIFKSETDSELILHLIAQPYTNTNIKLEERVFNAIQKMEGSFAIAVACLKNPEKVVLARRGCPMAVTYQMNSNQNQVLKKENVVSVSVQHTNVLENKNKFPKKKLLEENYPDTDTDTCCVFSFSSDYESLRAHGSHVFSLENDDDIFVINTIQNNATLCTTTNDKNNERFIPFEGDTEHILGRSGEANAMNNVPSNTRKQNIHNEIATIPLKAVNENGAYMWNEMHEQPKVILRALQSRMAMEPTANKDEDNVIRLDELDDVWPRFKNAQRFVFIGCGTSYNAALASRILFERETRRSVNVERAALFIDRSPPIFETDACVFISQSGETADTLSALAYCKAKGALCVSLVNVPNSTLVRESHAHVLLRAGVERSVASTKAYTAQLSLLTLLAARLALSSQNRTALLNALRRVPYAIEVALQWANPWAQHLAKEWKDEPRALLLGRGADEATVEEGALKIKELAYVMADACHAGELKHGPLALVDQTLPIIVIVPSHKTDSTMASRMHVARSQIHARNGNPFLVGAGVDVINDTKNKNNKNNKNDLPLPCVGHDVIQCIVNVIPLQLLAFHWASVRGLNVDRPRNLAKSVTVE